MGLLDSLLGMATGQGSGAAAAQPPVHRGLLDFAMGMIANRSTGGLGGLLGKFQNAGLGSQVASWVGNGPNQPVSADQVHSALGADQIAQLAQKFGIPPEQVAEHLAQILPELVNHVTPNGQVPADHGMIESAIALLKGKLMGG